MLPSTTSKSPLSGAWSKALPFLAGSVRKSPSMCPSNKQRVSMHALHNVSACMQDFCLFHNDTAEKFAAVVVKKAHSIAPGPGSAYSTQQKNHYNMTRLPELPVVWLQQCLGSVSSPLLTSTAVCQILPSCYKSAMVDCAAYCHTCCKCICVRLTDSD